MSRYARHRRQLVSGYRHVIHPYAYVARDEYPEVPDGQRRAARTYRAATRRPWRKLMLKRCR
ncbi:hypothetical protein KCP73_21440 [Salmonella enterica subsp. enterica]|nr:hypothetical protein KCP73_21440 [Salmonella enterica subsp. enterica]